MPDTIRSIDLAAVWAAQRDEFEAATRRVLDSGWYVLGPEVREFESVFAAACGGGEAVGVANGTDAITLALMALGIGKGDAVITVSHTAVASVVGILRAGAVPVLVDIDPHSYTISVDHLSRTLAGWDTGATAHLTPRAILPVHLYGHAADMTAIVGLAERHGLAVIEDCAQAHGAVFGTRPLGTFGIAATFSFYPTKNLGAFGDAGAVLVRDPALAQNLRELRQYGWRTRYVSEVAGMNSRLDALQAAFLAVRLKGLDREIARRREIAAVYDARFTDLRGLRRPRVSPGVGHVWHQYVVATARRDDLAAHLASAGIETLVHYPVPVHLQPAHRSIPIGGDESLPETERAAREVLSLPIHPWLSDAEVARVAEAVTGYFD